MRTFHVKLIFPSTPAGKVEIYGTALPDDLLVKNEKCQAALKSGQSEETIWARAASYAVLQGLLREGTKTPEEITRAQISGVERIVTS